VTILAGFQPVMIDATLIFDNLGIGLVGPCWLARES
jgi:hypothetical protein